LAEFKKKQMTQEQIQKLKSLGELLANGTISTEEFNTLKAEILNQKIQIDEQPPHNPPQPEIENLKRVPEKNLNKQKIRLIGFQNTTTNTFIQPPNIDELDFNNINKDEEKLLKAFLRLKQIFSPANFTDDEMNIGNKLFTRLEIEEINAERPGLNFPWVVITSLISAGISLFLMYISPCFGFLGAGTGMASAALMSIFVLTRVSATKMDKILSVIAILLSIGAFIAYSSHFKGNTWELKDGNETTETTN
jgi:hypothetical protein